MSTDQLTTGIVPDADTSAGASDTATADSIAYASTIAASNPLRGYEWYLDGYLTPGSNQYGANVDLISTEYTGEGVRIGLIDEGFDLSNSDLTNRFDLASSYDPRDTGTINITPDSSLNVHGTWVAGVVGASADNGMGSVGVASDATLVGYYARYGSGGSSRTELADLLARQVNVDISNNSWGYTTQFADNFCDPAWAVMKDALQAGATEGRGGLGTVYVFAAGNDRQYVANSLTYDGDNTNYHSLTNSRYVITAAATTQDGHVTSFTTPGASILVAAPGESILTTALNNGDGDPTNDYAFVSGTSFAAPIVSGVVALMLQANPELGYRDVQEILTLSSHKVDPTSASWGTNGATNWNGGANLVSNDFGFGLVDAHAAVRLAETWTTTHTDANESVISLTGNVGTNTAFVDNQPKDYVVTVSPDHQNFSIDWVEVDVSLLHTHDGDLRIELVSPTGTHSVLMDQPAAGTNSRSNLTFTFSTTHDWSESPVGDWHLIVTDVGTGGTGSMQSFSVRVYGDDEGSNHTSYYTDDFATLTGDRGTLAATAGTDTVNAAAVTTDLAIDLHPGATSTIAGKSVVAATDALIENVYGGDGNDTITGNDADNHLVGGHGDDTLTGGAGNDILDGGTGADTMIGGTGNDTYHVDQAGDVVTENPGEGTDLVHTTLSSYALGANLENLTFDGTGDFHGTGNELDNVITGGAGNDTLIGGAGNDTLDGGPGADLMIGGTGDDTYYVDHAGDVVTEFAGEGTDLVHTTLSSYTLGANLENLTFDGTADFHGTGNELDNVIHGGSGNDTLDGGAGADTMIGGAGNDTYYVDKVGDVVTEYPGEGIDLVHTTLSSYALGANLENLTFDGTADFHATGNELDNVIHGGSGNDTLDGGSGADTMIGGTGDDTYYVDQIGDVVTENPGEGTDLVHTTLSSYVLGANVENLTFDGAGDFHGTGNALDNVIHGGSGNDTLDGGAGNDTLDGGTGADTMIGGTGDDTYVVDHPGDVVIENPGEGNDLVQTTLASYVLAANVENLTYTGSGNFIATGNDLNNTIIGGSGSDIIDGGYGADMMKGGQGDDIYFVDNVNDVVVEQPGQGLDVVVSYVDYACPANVELLYLMGGATTATGDGHDNVLFGAYADASMTLNGDGGNDILYGSNFDDVLNGGSGNDVLFGLGGSDTLYGGTGDDTYFIDAASDQVIENPGEGTDSVYAPVDYTLPDNVEMLFTYANATHGTGNDGDNVLLGCYATSGQTLDGGAGNDTIYGSNYDDTLIGGSGNDYLQGYLGNDTMIGGTGDDVYIVENAGDVVVENANEGNDIVYAAVDYVLPDNVEALFIYGSATSATGNAGDNTIIGSYISTGTTLDGAAGDDTIIGGAGNDTIIGGTGADTLTGMDGNDTFVFRVGEANGDTITDFDGKDAAAGDQLEFVGFGPGAHFSQIDTMHWEVEYNGGASHETITFANAASIHASDVLFV